MNKDIYDIKGKLSKETESVVREYHCIQASRHYGIGSFRRLTGKKSKNAARCGIIKVREKKYREKKERPKKDFGNLIINLGELFV